MSRLLYVYENNMPTVSLMKEGAESAPEDYPYESVFASVKDISSVQLNAAEVVILIRPTDLLSFNIARWSCSHGKYLIVFTDDDILNGNQDSYINRSRVKYFRKALGLADQLWTNSPRIAEKYYEMTRGKQYMITETTIDPADIYPHTVKNEKIKIVYAAGSSHNGLFEKNISPIVQKLYDDLGDVFTMTFVGVHPSIPLDDGMLGRIEYRSLMTLAEYREFMKESNFDIGVAPLNSDEFSKCKYFNKFFEYGMFGIAGLYSDTEPYTYVINDGENGLLVKDGPVSWYNALRRVIEDDDLRSSISIGSQKTLRERFYPLVNDEEFRKHVPSEIDNIDQNAIVSDLQLRCTRMLYKVKSYYLYFMTAMEHLFKVGPVSLFKSVVAHIRNKLAYK